MSVCTGVSVHVGHRASIGKSGPKIELSVKEIQARIFLSPQVSTVKLDYIEGGMAKIDPLPEVSQLSSNICYS